MNIRDAILNRRTIRKFQEKKIDRAILRELVNFGRLAPTAVNLQPVKFAIITDDESLAKIYPNTKWAGYLKDGAPAEDERPVAYIAILGDNSIKEDCTTDVGAVIENILLGAMEYNIASCWLGAINRPEILKILGISEDDYSLLNMVALGYPKQESEYVDMVDDDIKYYRDDNGNIRVPKRKLEDVIVLDK